MADNDNNDDEDDYHDNLKICFFFCFLLKFFDWIKWNWVPNGIWLGAIAVAVADS